MPNISVPERNKQVKDLLRKTYPDAKIGVKAGRGTAYRWIEITFDRRVDLPKGSAHDRLESALIDLILGAGIHISTYSSDYGGVDGHCITITMPREPRG